MITKKLSIHVHFAFLKTDLIIFRAFDTGNSENQRKKTFQNGFKVCRCKCERWHLTVNKYEQSFQKVDFLNDLIYYLHLSVLVFYSLALGRCLATQSFLLDCRQVTYFHLQVHTYIQISYTTYTLFFWLPL